MPRLETKFYETESIEDHAELIRGRIERSLKDPETRKLALKIIGGAPDDVLELDDGSRVAAVQYHGKWYALAPDGAVPPGCRMRDAACEIEAIWNFVVLNIAYRNDVDGYDVYQDLRTTLESHGGDCDDFTIAFCALLRAAGYRCRARIVSQDGQHWSHVYPVVHLKGRGWVPLDATEEGKQPGWEFPGLAAIRDFDMGVFR